METDLAPVFRSLYAEKDGRIVAFENDPRQFNQLRKRLTESPTSKTWAKIRATDDLWLIPKIALLLSETALVYGAGAAPQVVVAPRPARPFSVEPELFERLAEKIACPALCYAPDSVLRSWLNDAAPLLQAGRAAYLPERILFYTPAHGQHWVGEPLEQNVAWETLNPAHRPQTYFNPLVHAQDPLVRAATVIRVLAFELPVLPGLSLADFHAFLDAEHRLVAALRKAIAKVVSEAMILSIEDQNTAAILPKMAKLKRELIEPEASALAARYETLRDSPRPKAAKAPLAAVELSLAMAVNPASGVAYVPALAESLRGVETPALRCQRDPSGGKQNPWYLLWKPAPAAR